MNRRWIPLLLTLAVVAGCQKKEAIRFGAVLPLTGPRAVYGESIKEGLDLALETLEADKSVGPIDLMIVDSGGDPEKAAEATKDLFGDGVAAVIGGVTTPEALAMVPVADRADRVILSPSASSPELTGISENFYRVYPSDFLEGTKMGNFAAQTLRLENAVILASESLYAKGVQQVFQAEFERNGGTVIELLEFPEGTTDFSGLLERVQTLEPQSVYLAGFAAELAPMIIGLREMGFEGSILTTSAFAAVGALEKAGDAAADVFLTQTSFELPSEDPNVQAFAAAYHAQYGHEPDIYAAHGYDALMVLAEAHKRGVRTPGDYWQNLRAIRAFPGVTGSLQFDERGDVQKFPRVYAVSRDRRLLNYERELQRRRKELVERLRQLDKERRTSGDSDG